MKNNQRLCDADAGARSGDADTIAEVTGVATKEQIYQEQLVALGIYDPAFDPAIHQLCILERELSRAQKQWKATAAPGQAPLVTSPIYQIICQLRRDIRASRDELGLTPKALKRLKGAAPASPEAPQQGIISRLDEIKRRVEAYDHG